MRRHSLYSTQGFRYRVRRDCLQSRDEQVSGNDKRFQTYRRPLVCLEADDGSFTGERRLLRGRSAKTFTSGCIVKGTAAVRVFTPPPTSSPFSSYQTVRPG